MVMILVRQTIFGSDNTDALRACVATVLRKELYDIPEFHLFDNWQEEFFKFITSSSIAYATSISPVEGFSIAAVETASDAVHYIVMLDGAVFFDPSDSNVLFNTDSITSYMVLEKLNIDRIKRHQKEYYRQNAYEFEQLFGDMMRIGMSGASPDSKMNTLCKLLELK
jgi:hypothetical protein